MYVCLGVRQTLEESKRIEFEARAEATRQMELATEAQKNYEREILLHAKDIDALAALKSVAAGHSSEKGELEDARQKVKS